VDAAEKHQEDTASMRVSIDQDRCTGHGRCYSLAPGVFTDDELGAGTVIGDGEVPVNEEQAARGAQLACPERAITVVD
jgi:ferredoxin